MGCDAVPIDEQHANHPPAVVALGAELSAEMRPTGALGRSRLIVWADAAEIGRLRRLRAFDIEHRGRRTPPVDLTIRPDRPGDPGRTTSLQSGGE